MCEKHENETPAVTKAVEPQPQAAQASGGSCCGGPVNITTPPRSSAAPTDATSDDQADTAECPVMIGTVVDKAVAEAAGLFRDYNGQRYWFCCASCGPLWDADPAKYAAA